MTPLRKASTSTFGPVAPLIAGIVYVLLFVAAWWRLGWGAATTGGLFLMIVAITPPLVYFVRRQGAAAQTWSEGRTIVVVAAFLAVAIPAAWFWNQGQLIPDEGTYLFQARTYATASLSLPSPLTQLGESPASVRAVSFIHTIHNQGRWFGKYTPGWPLLLAIAVAVHADWLLNALLCALLIALTVRIGREFYSARTGFVAGVLLAASPFLFFTAMGRMAHAFCSVLVAGAILYALRSMRTPRLAPFAAMLGFIVLAIQVRPYTGAVAGAALAACVLWSGRNNARASAQRLAAGVIAMSCAAVLIGLYNRAVTGHFLQTPYALYTSAGVLPGELAASTTVLLENLRNRFRWSLEIELLFTGPFLLLGALFAWRDREHRRETFLLLLLAVGLIAAHLPTTMPPGGRWGDRFHTEGLAAYILAAARGVELAAGALRPAVLRALCAAFLLVQSAHLGFTYPEFVRNTFPVARLRAASNAIAPANDVAFIAAEGTTPTGFLPSHWNPEPANWQSAPRLFLIDPGPAAREEMAAALHRCEWLILTYDARAEAARVERGRVSTGACAAAAAAVR